MNITRFGVFRARTTGRLDHLSLSVILVDPTLHHRLQPFAESCRLLFGQDYQADVDGRRCLLLTREAVHRLTAMHFARREPGPEVLT